MFDIPHYRGLAPFDIIIEYCTRSTFHTKHCPEKYLEYFQTTRSAFLQKYPHMNVVGNPEDFNGVTARGRRPWRVEDHLQPLEDVARPRLGAFEVTMMSQKTGPRTVFSKLTVGRWPNARSLVRRAERLFQGENLPLIQPDVFFKRKYPGVNDLSVKRNQRLIEPRAPRTWEVAKPPPPERVRDLRELSSKLARREAKKAELQDAPPASKPVARPAQRKVAPAEAPSTQELQPLEELHEEGYSGVIDLGEPVREEDTFQNANAADADGPEPAVMEEQSPPAEDIAEASLLPLRPPEEPFQTTGSRPGSRARQLIPTEAEAAEAMPVADGAAPVSTSAASPASREPAGDAPGVVTSSSQDRPPPSRERFHVELLKTEHNRKLGFKFDRASIQERSSSTAVAVLRITSVADGGLLAQVNDQHLASGEAHLVVTAGMFIEAANDVEGDGDRLADVLRSCDRVRLRLRRSVPESPLQPRKPEEPSQTTGSRPGSGGRQLKAASTNEEALSILEATLVADAPAPVSASLDLPAKPTAPAEAPTDVEPSVDLSALKPPAGAPAPVSATLDLLASPTADGDAPGVGTTGSRETTSPQWVSAAEPSADEGEDAMVVIGDADAGGELAPDSNDADNTISDLLFKAFPNSAGGPGSNAPDPGSASLANGSDGTAQAEGASASSQRAPMRKEPTFEESEFEEDDDMPTGPPPPPDKNDSYSEFEDSTDRHSSNNHVDNSSSTGALPLAEATEEPPAPQELPPSKPQAEKQAEEQQADLMARLLDHGVSAEQEEAVAERYLLESMLIEQSPMPPDDQPSEDPAGLPGSDIATGKPPPPAELETLTALPAPPAMSALPSDLPQPPALPDERHPSGPLPPAPAATASLIEQPSPAPPTGPPPTTPPTGPPRTTEQQAPGPPEPPSLADPLPGTPEQQAFALANPPSPSGPPPRTPEQQAFAQPNPPSPLGPPPRTPEQQAFPPNPPSPTGPPPRTPEQQALAPPSPQSPAGPPPKPPSPPGPPPRTPEHQVSAPPNPPSPSGPPPRTPEQQASAPPNPPSPSGPPPRTPEHQASAPPNPPSPSGPPPRTPPHQASAPPNPPSPSGPPPRTPPHQAPAPPNPPAPMDAPPGPPSDANFDDFEESEPPSPSRGKDLGRMIAEADTSGEAALFAADLSIFAHSPSNFVDGIQAESPEEIQVVETQRVEDIDFSAAAEDSSPAGVFNEEEGEGGVYELENAETLADAEGEYDVAEFDQTDTSHEAPDDYEDDFSSDAGESAGEDTTSPVAASATARALSSTYASLRPNTGTDYGDDFIEDDDDLG